MICPVCEKDTAELVYDKSFIPSYRVVCKNCGTKTAEYDTPLDAINALNVMKYDVGPCDIFKKTEPDPNNPYTDFAKEMSLLHEALKVEGFKDAMVDILAAMSPVVWEKVQFEDQKHWLHKTLGINVDDFVAKCNHDNKKPRPENWGGGAMT